jgi:transposase
MAVRGRPPKLADPDVIAWVLGRARCFVQEEAKPGKRRRRRDPKPAWSYREIAANLQRARGISVSANTLLEMVRREAPEVARARAKRVRRPRPVTLSAVRQMPGA